MVAGLLKTPFVTSMKRPFLGTLALYGRMTAIWARPKVMLSGTRTCSAVGVLVGSGLNNAKTPDFGTLKYSPLPVVMVSDVLVALANVSPPLTPIVKATDGVPEVTKFVPVITTSWVGAFVTGSTNET